MQKRTAATLANMLANAPLQLLFCLELDDWTQPLSGLVVAARFDPGALRPAAVWVAAHGEQSALAEAVVTFSGHTLLLDAVSDGHQLISLCRAANALPKQITNLVHDKAFGLDALATMAGENYAPRSAYAEQPPPHAALTMACWAVAELHRLAGGQ